MINLHLRPRAVVTGVHVEDDISPSLRRSSRLTVGAGVVPGVDAAGL
jgi:hypothetical protein